MMNIKKIQTSLRAFFSLSTPRLVSARTLYVLWGIFFALCVSVLLWITYSVQAPGTLVAMNAKRFIPDVRISVYVWCVMTIMLYFLVYRLSYTKRQAKIVQYIAVSLLAVMLIISLGIHPTRSQDGYWNLLLARGATEYHLNPYTTTPNMLVHDSWSASVPAWRTQTMSHGPLWVIPLMGITALTDSLAIALVYTKVFLCAGLIALYIVLWKLLLLDGRPLVESRKLWIFFALQPLWFQYIVIDMHNDIWIAVSIVASLFFFKKKRFQASAVALVLGASVKYVSIFLLPIPLWFAWKEAGSLKQFFRSQFSTIVLCTLSLVFFYVVQYSPDATLGLYTEIFERGRQDFLLPGSMVVSAVVSGNHILLRIIGLLLFGVTAWFCISKQRFYEAYILPFAVLLICGTPWFHAWYGLWIFPLLWMVVSPGVIIIIATALLLMFEIIMPSHIIWYLCMCAMMYGLVRGIFFLVQYLHKKYI